MDLNRARDLIENVFSEEFNREAFIKFASNLLNSNFSKPSIFQGNQIPEQFKDGVISLERLSSYIDSSDKKIDLLIVTLKKDTALDRGRTMQRNFVARYLDHQFKDAALVAFVSPGYDYWRFSLIQIESKLEGVKVVDEYTPAKRWSFLLGKNEGCHTAKSQLLEILASDNEKPTLDELIEAFNVEIVTKEFYEKYRELFDRMTSHLNDLIANDIGLKDEFEKKQIEPSDFARKTMGQISFLYFLQKKGWFGVRPGKAWGSGVKNFVRSLFNRREDYGSNFFNDVLEPLFYEALALDRRDNDSIYSRLNHKESEGVRMPFLNGGLFEPLNGYSWKTTKITLPDELFSNKANNDEGDGILDVFDLYNFTVNESEPLEIEVAVDPEMLGKVFENLLPENTRKGKGAYYTPRPIVHYMCQESLINYLFTKLNGLVVKQEIEIFIREDIGQSGLSDSLKACAGKIDDLLANIKVCDPAVGSGAFPLGMLNEIVKARSKIGEFSNSKISIYDLKLHAISNSIYGVDIDPGAIEIAKLRFWLSLVVEEDKPSPLPNLDHKIMQGDSLISEYKGINLFDDEMLVDVQSRHTQIDEIESTIQALQQEYFSLHSKGEYTNTSKSELEEKIKPLNNKIKLLKKQNILDVESSGLFEKELVNKQIAQTRAKALQAKVAQHISTHSQSDKERLKDEIEELKWSLIEITLQEEGELERLDEIKNLRRLRIKPFFIWKLEFSEVFKQNGGFDVVIANPPYGVKVDASLRDLYNLGNKDTYGLFMVLATEGLLNPKGIMSYIVSDTWLTIKTHFKLREKMMEKQIHHVIRLHQDCFTATVNSCIFQLKNIGNTNDNIFAADLTNISTRKELDDLNRKLINLRDYSGFSTPKFAVYEYPQNLIKSNSNFPVFVASPKLFTLMNNTTCRTIEKEGVQVRQIEMNGKTIELVGFLDIAEVKQGLATGDNKHYLYQTEKSRGTYKNIEEKKEYILNDADIKKITSNPKLRLKVIKKGFHKTTTENDFDSDLYFNGRYIVPYDKGGESNSKDGWMPNYYVPTDYFIDWSQDSIRRLNTLTIRDRNAINNQYSGSDNLCAVIRNSETYFQEGISSSRVGIYSPTFRKGSDTVYDSGCGNIFCSYHKNEFLLGILSSKLIKLFFKSSINHTVNSQVDDMKELPFIIESDESINKLVSDIIAKQKQYLRYDYMSNEQIEIDNLVYKLYGLNEDDIIEVETWYARRYPNLRRQN